MTMRFCLVFLCSCVSFEHFTEVPGQAAIDGVNTTDQQKPGPAQLTATAGDAQVSLAWSAVDGAASYVLYSATAAGAQAARTAVTGTISLQQGLTNGVEYVYTVTAVIGDAESAPSPEARATPHAAMPMSTGPTGPTGLPPPPDAPGVTLSASGFSEPNVYVDIAFTASLGATSYNVYWQTSPGVTKTGSTVVPATTSPVQVQISACTATIYAAATALGPGGESALSAEKSARFCPGSCTRPAAFPSPAYLVDASAGSDISQHPACFPYRTLARGLSGRTNGEVVVASGVFNEHDVVVPPGVTLAGDPANPGVCAISGPSGVTNYAIGLSSNAHVNGMTLSVPGKTAIYILGASAHVENTRAVRSAVGVDVNGITGVVIDGLTATGNTSQGVVAANGSSDIQLQVTNSVLKDNQVGLYIDSYYHSSTITVSNSTIACNTQHDIHSYVPDNVASGPVLTFALTNLTMDTYPPRTLPVAPSGCAGTAEVCQPDATMYGEANGTVVFNLAGVVGSTATCP
jgi:hypothetical protein